METSNLNQLTQIIEALLMTAPHPLSLKELSAAFGDDDKPTPTQLQTAIDKLRTDYQTRGVNLHKTANGFCFQVPSKYAAWINHLWQTKPPKMSKPMLETLAIIAYQQPVTRAEIEKIRGVSLSSTILQTLIDYEWIKIAGKREAPGNPNLYATTTQFLNHFCLTSLSELPELPKVNINTAPQTVTTTKPKLTTIIDNEVEVCTLTDAT